VQLFAGAGFAGVVMGGVQEETVKTK